MTVDDEERHVARRSQHLASNDVGLRDTVAEAVAWAQLGFSASGIATKMDVTEGTARKYLDTASERYPGIVVAGPEDDLDDVDSPAASECPVCLHGDGLASPTEANEAYLTSTWGATAMLDVEQATAVCSWCKSVEIGGEWKRMKEPSDRARGISEAGNKTYDEAMDSITGGIEPGKQSPSASATGTKAADGHADLEW
jgi:predicted transcriptional regulator